MLSEREHDALVQWYSLPEILDESRRLVQSEAWEDLEEHLQMRCLFALSRHFELPDFMRDDSGGALFPTNLNPATDLEKWQDAIDVAWEVMEKEFGLTHDDIHRRVAVAQHDDWEAFMKSVEQRRKERGN